MDLDIDLNLVDIVVAEAPSFDATYVRDLTKADIKLLAVKEASPDGSGALLVKRLSERHHALARALAKGMTNWEAGLAAGYKENYVSILRADPSFQNLISFYQDQKTREQANFNDLAHDLTVGAMHSMLDDLEDPEKEAKLTPGQKLAYAAFGADRNGHAPQSTAIHKHEHTINMAARMQAARERIDAQRIVDITPQKEDAA